ncbi:(Fe-S)-binding protein [Zavarzinia sp. CC-PAN008]|uniref:(Fe-S)-binding protein n=1 Tax=Zavarzinia sp. CC-PAN008 TaxID=3243332 RepID=UPI003F742551
MKEGSTEAPIRHPIAWQDPDFTDPAKIDAEMRRIFDICHGCRRCFNLCDSFPRLFDLVDNSPTEELDGVKSEDFKPVVDACTLCDMCFLTKCPYVPPHEFNLDFPHLMLRYRVAERQAGEKNTKVERTAAEMAKMDRNGTLGALVSPVVNWAGNRDNGLTRPLMEKVAGIDRDAKLPKFVTRTFNLRARGEPLEINKQAPAYGRKAVLYSTCFVNYNDPNIGMATRAILARNGVETEIVYPACCGMPKLEQGDIAAVAASADKVSRELAPWIEKGYDVIALTPSCALMLKFEWPLIVPGNALVKTLADATYDSSEYIVEIAKKHGLAEGLQPLDGGVTVHIACHARAQNMGQKAAEMLRLIPGVQLSVIERCSGHGGTFGVLEGTHKLAMKVGKPVFKQAAKLDKTYIASECPLAARHIADGMETVEHKEPRKPYHPVEILAKAYGLA